MLRDKSIRGFLIGIIVFALLFAAFDIVVGIRRQNEIKTALVNQQAATASALIERGVPESVIAAAVTGTEITAEGKGIMGKLGLSENADSAYIPFASEPVRGAMLLEVIEYIVLSAILFALVLTFILRRERLYQSAIKAVTKLDDEPSLPQSDEGSIYRLFEGINNMAAALRSKQESEQKTKEFLKRTVSDISHQLKTPLAALSMYNEIILDEPENTDTVIEFTRKSGVAIERIKTLILELLKITRLDSGGIEFDKKLHTTKDIIDAAVQNLTQRASREEKEILVDCGNEEIKCDLNWTSEAVGNIVKNALDHTAEGGIVRIGCENTPIETRIVIADNGSGIAPEDFHHIFKRFYRSKNSGDSQGVGLGLPLAKAIVEGQGGIISVQSEQGVGTTFTLSFLR
ncbi:MAG: HAMP domain-containing histidine kinase [Oscillospiraceae bacterium]|nr:HAMP domain-containing histidine kinase [Oscillospiraceae bacterium]